jgi:hypothetical protein
MNHEEEDSAQPEPIPNNKASRKRGPNRYEMILLHVFENKFVPGSGLVPFTRDELVDASAELKLERPKNVGDLLAYFRYRSALPNKIVQSAPAGKSWVILPAGRGKYRLQAVELPDVNPNKGLLAIKVPDSTPGIISRYAKGDEQALLAKVRYNRLVDIFTGITCYSLQSHYRTTVPDLGQIETDEVYVGVDKGGVHYVLPVQAKGDTGGRLALVQVDSDLLMCREKFGGLVCRPIGAQFLEGGTIAMFEFEVTERGLEVAAEHHYRLVRPDELTAEELESYRKRIQP